MAVDMAIKNCKIVFPEGIISGAGVAVDGEKIVAVVKEPLLPNADEVIDAKGNYLFPGLMEPHAHLSYGTMQLYAGHIKQETTSGLIGGITTFMIKLPSQGLKVPYEELEKTTNDNLMTDMAFQIGIGTVEHTKQLRHYAECGITDFKFHMYAHEKVGVKRGEDDIIWRTFVISNQLIKEGYPIVIRFHCDNQRVHDAAMQMMLESGKNTLEDYYKSLQDWTIIEGLRRVLFLQEHMPNVPIYIVHMRHGDGVPLCAEAKGRGLPVWLETEPQYLTFTRESFNWKNQFGDQRDIDMLWKGIQDGIVDCIGTDHEVAYKEDYMRRKGTGKVIWDEWAPGHPIGAPTTLSVLLHYGVHKGQISLEKVCKLMALNPAKAHSIFPQKGTIAVGSDADFAIVDLDLEKKVTSELLHSTGDMNYWLDQKLKGWTVMTISKGKVVMEATEKDEAILGKPGHGKVLRRKKRLVGPSGTTAKVDR